MFDCTTGSMDYEAIKCVLHTIVLNFIGASYFGLIKLTKFIVSCTVHMVDRKLMYADTILGSIAAKKHKTALHHEQNNKKGNPTQVGLLIPTRTGFPFVVRPSHARTTCFSVRGTWFVTSITGDASLQRASNSWKSLWIRYPLTILQVFIGFFESCCLWP